MISKLKKRIVKAGGIVGASAYYADRISNELYARRFGLRSALALTLPRYSPAEIGFADTVHNHVHIATDQNVLGQFRKAMDRYVKPSRNDVLLDYGSGLGGALLMAATYPFQRIIGLEFSAALSLRSAKIVGVARSRARCTRVDLLVGDAQTFVVPDDVTVIYFFNAFSGAVLDQALSRVRESRLRRHRTIRFVCLNPAAFDAHIRGSSHGWWLRMEGTVPGSDGGYPINVYVSTG